MWLVDLNYIFECDWPIELSDNKLSNNKLSNKKLFDNNLPSELVENMTFLNQSQAGKFLWLQKLFILKWYDDENRIFPIEASLRHNQVVCMRRKMLSTIFKYLFSFQRYSNFLNMQISQVMTSYN